MDSCAACHRLSGSGESFAFPTLAGNSSVLNSDPSSLIAVILNGARLPSADAAPTGLAMPPFGWRYDDADIAKLATFVRANWGNSAPPVTAAGRQRSKAAIRLSAASLVLSRTSSGGPAAVDDQHRALIVGGLVGGEMERCRNGGHYLRAP